MKPRLGKRSWCMGLASACALLAAVSAPARAQSPSEWQKCTVDSDCILIRGTCGPVAGNRLFIQQLQRKEEDLAAQIRRDPKGPVSCASYERDPYDGAFVVCNKDVRWCQVLWPPGKTPRLKQ